MCINKIKEYLEKKKYIREFKEDSYKFCGIVAKITNHTKYCTEIRLLDKYSYWFKNEDILESKECFWIKWIELVCKLARDKTLRT